MAQNEQLSELDIQQLGPKGDGVAFGTRERVFVERTLVGDRVQAKLRRDRQGIVRGEVLQILVPSAHRAKPSCAHYDSCGNCTLQHMQEQAYRSWKLEVVREALKKQRLNPVRWLPPVFVASGKRRRATFSAVRDGEKVLLGYYRRRSRQIVDIRECLVSDPKILSLKAALLPLLPSLLVENHPLDIFVQLVDRGIDLVFTGPVPHKRPEQIKAELTSFAAAHGVTRIGWRRVEREASEQLVYRGPVMAQFGMLQVALPAASFLQPTLDGQRALTQAVLCALPFQVDSSSRLADLFSGCGTFSGPMLERGSVDAYESLPQPVTALSRASNGFPLRVFRRDLFSNPLKPQELNRYDAVVFDPPRAGCPEQATQMARAKTRTLVGVSCNPATFARDARLICDGGYRLQSVQVVDQFLWSHHVEVVGVFTK